MSFETVLFVAPADQGDAVGVARSTWIRGYAWRPDGRGLVYSTSRGDTMPYPPSNNLRTINLDGTGDRSLTFGDASLHEPDVHASGRLVVTRSLGRSDIWSFPCSGAALENVREARRVTRQTGQVQVPSASPDGRAIAYISDHGGHSNVWVLDGGDVRQVTFEQDPETVIGIASWSPRGDWIVFVRAYRGKLDLHLVAPDGSESRVLLENAFGAYWSRDGQWVYCSRDSTILRINVDDGRIEHIRADALAPSISDGDVANVLHAHEGGCCRWRQDVGDPQGATARWSVECDRRCRRGPLAAGAAVQSPFRFVPRRTLARSAAHRWRYDEPLGAAHRWRNAMADHRFRRSRRHDCALDVVVTGWPLAVRRCRGSRSGRRDLRRAALNRGVTGETTPDRESSSCPLQMNGRRLPHQQHAKYRTNTPISLARRLQNEWPEGGSWYPSEKARQHY